MADEFDDIEFDIDLAQVAEIERRHASTSNLRQLDLRGNPVSAPAASTLRSVSAPSTTSAHGQNTFAKVRAVKRWDPKAFAKFGWSKRVAAASKRKRGKRKASDDWDGDEDEDEDLDPVDDDGEDDVVYDNDPAAAYSPPSFKPDSIAMCTFVYPILPSKPRRDYQYNIVRSALLNNTLVSLPTGLGKTFIAACVMLNFYRWFPKSRVVFMAPTRPLVGQQITACHEIAGISPRDCVELTGHTQANMRALAWQTKRVIYSTPQTVENDLRKGRIDPRDISCIVVDEAHRATGDYAYCSVVRFMMSRNRHFRVLALTATPGSKDEAVQDVIDNLHIGKIEVRTDASIDIIPYIHNKQTELTVVPLGPVVTDIRKRFGDLMEPLFTPARNSKIIYATSVDRLHPFQCTAAFREIDRLPGGKRQNGHFFPILKTLGAMARALELLVVHSITSFEQGASELLSERRFKDSHPLKDIVREVRQLSAQPDFVPHPKMDRLRSIVVDWFAQSHEGAEAQQTRVMVFCNFRAVVDEIVSVLNQQRPLVRAHQFVGQGVAKGGKRGTTQKEQIEIIKRFKQGEINTLVATSIGEEGLDIGEVDLIVCYETSKSPIRMLQRVGRTGRARDGKIIVLAAEGKEEGNWKSAKNTYHEVQNAIVSGRVFELFVDGERMVPQGVSPAPDFQEIKAESVSKDIFLMGYDNRLSRQIAADEKARRKREREQAKKLPKNAKLGFTKASELSKKPSSADLLAAREKAALLTSEETNYLRERWAKSSEEDKIRPVAIDPQHFKASASAGPFKFASHSARYRRLEADKSRCDDLLFDYGAWHDTMAQSFRPDLIEVTRPCRRPGEHKSLRPVRYPDDVPCSLPPPSAMPASLFLSDDDDAELPTVSQLFAQRRARLSSGNNTAPPRDRSPSVEVVQTSSTSRRSPPKGRKERSPSVVILESSGQRAPDKAPSSTPPPAASPPAVENASLQDQLVQQRSKPRFTQEAAAAALGGQNSHDDEDEFSFFSFDADALRACDDAAAAQLAHRAATPPSPVAIPQQRAPTPDAVADASSAGRDENEEAALMPPPLPPTKDLHSTLTTPQSGVVRRPYKRKQPGALVQSAKDGVASSPMVPARGRLRRGERPFGGQEAESDEGDTAQGPRERKVKRKKRRIGFDDAKAVGIFDTEAVHSSASGSGSASEGYASENSEDRQFVASDQSQMDSPGMDQIYRDSIRSQALPAGFGPASHRFAPGGARARFGGGGGGGLAAIPSPVSERSGPPSSWSYGSFVVPDEEDVSFESSSMPPSRVN